MGGGWGAVAAATPQVQAVCDKVRKRFQTCIIERNVLVSANFILEPQFLTVSIGAVGMWLIGLLIINYFE